MARLVALVVALVLVADAALCALIVARVPYTEIDWRAYMAQMRAINAGGGADASRAPPGRDALARGLAPSSRASQVGRPAGFLGGERDYSKLVGETGPCVYPALHVYAFAALYEATDAARTSRARSSSSSRSTSPRSFSPPTRTAARAAPLVALLVLPLSRRAHSLFVLRLFNDGVGAPLWCASHPRRRDSSGCSLASARSRAGTSPSRCSRGRWRLGCVTYSLAVGTKMSQLLSAPGLLLLLLQARARAARSRRRALRGRAGRARRAVRVAARAVRRVPARRVRLRARLPPQVDVQLEVRAERLRLQGLRARGSPRRSPRSPRSPRARGRGASSAAAARAAAYRAAWPAPPPATLRALSADHVVTTMFAANLERVLRARCTQFYAGYATLRTSREGAARARAAARGRRAPRCSPRSRSPRGSRCSRRARVQHLRRGRRVTEPRVRGAAAGGAFRAARRAHRRRRARAVRRARQAARRRTAGKLLTHLGMDLEGASSLGGAPPAHTAVVTRTPRRHGACTSPPRTAARKSGPTGSADPPPTSSSIRVAARAIPSLM